MVGVTSFDDEPGSYEVAVHAMELAELTVEEPATGDLGSDGAVAGVWGFAGSAGDVVSVTAGSDDFDPVVELLSPGGERLARDDDSGPGTDARLLAVLPETGLYVVRVTASDEKFGSYEMTLQAIVVQQLEVNAASDGVLH